MSAKSTAWIIGTVLASVVVGAIAWFALINPQFESAAEVRDQAAEAASYNEILELNIARLRAEDAKIPEYEQQIAKVREKIPVELDLPAVTRTLAALAGRHDVVITQVTNSPLATVAAAEAATPTSTAPAPDSDTQLPGEEESGTETGSDAQQQDGVQAGDFLIVEEEGDAAQLPQVQFAGLDAHPVSVTLVGSPLDVEALIEEIQTEVERAFLVTGWTQTLETEQDFAGGKPATELGDATFQLDMLVFTLFDFRAERTVPDSSPVNPDELPRANRNVLDPVIIED